MAPEGLPRVWLIDSAQVARSESTDGRADMRQSISGLLWRVRDLATEYGAIALVVSQVSRASYASKDKEKRVDDLAAGAETRAVEQVAELLLHIDGNPKKTVEIRCAKNRYTGELFTIPCRVDFPTATFHELDVQSIEIDKEATQESEVHEAKKAVLAALNLAEGLSGRQVIAAVLLRGSLVYLALKSLARDGAIRFEKGPKNSHVWRVAR